MEALNEFVLRLGMAEEWAVDPRYREQAKEWVLLIALPRVLGPNAHYWSMPFLAPSAAVALFPNSRLIFTLSKFLRNSPWLGHTVKRLEESRAGRGAAVYSCEFYPGNILAGIEGTWQRWRHSLHCYESDH